MGGRKAPIDLPHLEQELVHALVGPAFGLHFPEGVQDQFRIHGLLGQEGVQIALLVGGDLHVDRSRGCRKRPVGDDAPEEIPRPLPPVDLAIDDQGVPGQGVPHEGLRIPPLRLQVSGERGGVVRHTGQDGDSLHEAVEKLGFSGEGLAAFVHALAHVFARVQPSAIFAAHIAEGIVIFRGMADHAGHGVLIYDDFVDQGVQIGRPPFLTDRGIGFVGRWEVGPDPLAAHGAHPAFLPFELEIAEGYPGAQWRGQVERIGKCAEFLVDGNRLEIRRGSLSEAAGPGRGQEKNRH